MEAKRPPVLGEDEALLKWLNQSDDGPRREHWKQERESQRERREREGWIDEWREGGREGGRERERKTQ